MGIRVHPVIQTQMIRMTHPLRSLQNQARTVKVLLFCHPHLLLLLQVLIRLGVHPCQCPPLFWADNSNSSKPRVSGGRPPPPPPSQPSLPVSAAPSSMPGDLEDLLGGLPSSRPSNSSKPRVSGGRPPPSQPSLPVSAAPPPSRP